MKVKLSLGGKVFILQHPGNRAWLKLQEEIGDSKDGKTRLDGCALMDYCFEHVVFPEVGSKLSLDSINQKEAQEWGEILPSFLGGKLEKDYKWETLDEKPTPETGKDKK